MCDSILNDRLNKVFPQHRGLMETYNFEEAQEQLKDLVTRTTLENRQFRITSTEGNVVLLSQETYDNLIVTLELLSTPGLMDRMDCCLENSEDPSEICCNNPTS